MQLSTGLPWSGPLILRRSSSDWGITGEETREFCLCVPEDTKTQFESGKDMWQQQRGWQNLPASLEKAGHLMPTLMVFPPPFFSFFKILAGRLWKIPSYIQQSGAISSSFVSLNGSQFSSIATYFIYPIHFTAADSFACSIVCIAQKYLPVG